MKTLILDSTQLDSYWECPQKHAYSFIENLTLSNEIREEISAGTMMHKLLENYYTTDSPVGAAQLTYQVIEEEFPLSLPIQKQVYKRFEDYVMRYSSGDYRPLKKKVWRVEILPDGLPFDCWVEVPLVEQGFSYELLHTKEYLFVLEGRIDFLGESQDGQHLWMDHKLQFQAGEIYNKSIQFRNYSLVTGLNLGVINYIRMHKELSADTFKRSVISFSSLEMKQWKEELIEKYIEISQGKITMNRHACAGPFKKFPCQFTQLCEERNSVIRDTIKSTKYIKKEQWRPW